MDETHDNFRYSCRCALRVATEAEVDRCLAKPSGRSTGKVHIFGPKLCVWNCSRRSTDFRTVREGGLPATIRDATTACENMGLQYLWVGQLCIDQGNADELQLQVNQMHIIYRHAKCTLVTLSGKDSNYGLPGVASPRTWKHSIIAIGDLTFSNAAPNLQELVDNSRWSTRGWTFQEMAFSSNLLFFNDYSVHYWSERPGKERVLKSDSASLAAFGSFMHTKLDYWVTLRIYMKRNLTYYTYILRAIYCSVAMSPRRRNSILDFLSI
jgi:hypothetical protein